MIFLTRSTCIALVIAAITAVSSSTAITTTITDSHRSLQQLPISSAARELLKAVNDARATNGSPSLCINTKLATASQVQAVDMSAGGFISTSGSSGSTPTSRATDQGFNTTGVAELVGAGYANATHAVKEWMSSTQYNQYLLGDYEFMGAGYSFNDAKEYKTFWVLDFSKGGRGETCT